jgi:hypothetical protein
MSAAAVAEFDAWVATLGLRHFAPHEVRFLGNSHFASGKAKGKNTIPPKALRERLVPVLHAADEIRQRLGVGVVILSAYRSPAYNRAIRGAEFSRHVECDALDLAAPKVRITRLRAVAKELRKAGWFTGGLGLKYPEFVHIDNRGENVDF